MSQYRYLLLLASLALFAGCSSPEVIRYSGSSQVEQAAPAMPTAAEAQLAEQQEREQALAEQQAREAAARAREEARQAEIARMEAEAQARAAREAEERRRVEAARAAAARELAQKQQRIAALQNQIAANGATTRNLDAANAALRQAVNASESLTAVLTAEQEKYGTADPDSGELMTPLDKSGLEALETEVNQLMAEVERLMGQAE